MEIKNCSCSRLCCTKIKNLSVTLDGDAILQGVNMHFHCGDITAVIGPNGGGKSSLLKAIVGAYPYEGSLVFEDEKQKSTKPKIGYVPQQVSMEADSPLTVTDLFLAATTRRPICFAKNKTAASVCKGILTLLDCAHLANRKVAELSGGELQRITLALALLPMPNLLLLDEPISGIDQKGIEQFWNMISKLRKEHDLAIIIVTHDFQQVYNYADKVFLVNRTVLASGTPLQVFEQESFQNIFGKGGSIC